MYNEKALLDQLKAVENANALLYNFMEDESDEILTVLENYEILKEATGERQSETAKMSLWERIKIFFKEIFGKYKQASEKKFEENKEWLEANAGKLDSDTEIGDLEIELATYWVVNNGAKYKDLSDDDIEKKLFSKFMDSNGSISEGLKNLFRTGNAKEVNRETLKGSALASKLPEMKKYCIDYKAVHVASVQRHLNKVEKEMDAIDRAYTSKPVRENYSIVEESYFVDIFGPVKGKILLEATTDNKPEDKKDEKKPTEIDIKDGKNDADKTDTEKTSEKYKDNTRDDLNVAKVTTKILKLAITSLMTVQEEKYSVYMKVLKAAVAKSKGARKDDKEEIIKIKNNDKKEKNTKTDNNNDENNNDETNKKKKKKKK